ncbi:MAG: hypothetical protein M3040_06940 [Bacteroidota bacterium]|nr:hypothetical protein [Bacteroidota bacterium]
MHFQNEKDFGKQSIEGTNLLNNIAPTDHLRAEIEDTDPPSDEEDLNEMGLSAEEAEQIEWELPKKGSSGSEEKDITD